jgi:PAS domain S-box-containing protein
MMTPGEPLDAAWLARLVEDVPIGIYIYRLEDPEDDHTLRFVYGNPESERLTGVRVSQLVGRLIDECFPSLREHDFPARFARVVLTGEPDRYESLFYGDDRVLAAAFSGEMKPLPGSAMAVCFENITQRKQAEESRNAALSQRAALASELEAAHVVARDALESYEIVATATQEAIWEMRTIPPGAPPSLELPIRFSDRFATLLGYERSELPQTVDAMKRFVHPDDILRVRDTFVQLLSQPGKTSQFEYRVHTKSGEERIWRAAALATFDDHGHPRRAAGSVRDVTEERRAQRALEERLALIEEQRSLIAQLSTPILRIWDGVIALPIIGSVDAARAAKIMDQLLGDLANHGVRFALLDLTGVVAIDATTAEQLLRIASAARLLGTQTIITGIQPPVAQAIVELGVDLSAMETRRSLREGLSDCLGRLGPERSGTPRGV